jgi:hypothetical protein
MHQVVVVVVTGGEEAGLAVENEVLAAVLE